MAWLVAFLATLAIEVPLALWLLRGDAGARRRAAAAALAANTLSHPLFCFVLLRALPGPFLARVLAGECVVIALEAAVYRAALRLPSRRALALSATLNAASYLVGLFLLNAPA